MSDWWGPMRQSQNVRQGSALHPKALLQPDAMVWDWWRDAFHGNAIDNYFDPKKLPAPDQMAKDAGFDDVKVEKYDEISRILDFLKANPDLLIQRDEKDIFTPSPPDVELRRRRGRPAI